MYFVAKFSLLELERFFPFNKMTMLFLKLVYKFILTRPRLYIEMLQKIKEIRSHRKFM